MISCNNCSTENEDGSKFCINCGDQLIVRTGRRGTGTPSERRPARRGTSEVGYAEGKSTAVATVLSLLIVGLGQFYNGDTKKGGMMLAGGVVLGIFTGGILWLGFAAYSAYDAYQVAGGEKELGQW